MGLKGKVAALTSVVGVSLASIALAGADRADVDLTFGEERKNRATSLELGLKLSNRGAADNPGRLQIKFPRGSKLSDDAAPKCAASSFDDCPAGSQIGSGRAAFSSGSAYDLFVTNGESSLTIWVELSPGSYYDLRATVNGRTVDTPLFPFKTVNLNFDKVTSGGNAFIRTPTSCPISRRWTFTVKTTFYRDSPAGDDIVEIDKPKSPCQR